MDDHDEIRLSAEDEEKALIPGENESGKCRKIDLRPSTTFWRVVEVLLLSLTCLLLAANLITSESSVFRLENTPRRPDITLRFGDERKYMSLNPKYDEFWQAESSPNGGLIRLNADDPSDDKPQWGGIAMFHQLHCIAGFRKALQRARSGEDIGVDETDDAHWPHCLWYMRQTVLCMADDTIEMPHVWTSTISENGSVIAHQIGTIDGVNDLRVCKNSQELYKMRAEHGLEADKIRNEFLEKQQRQV